MPFVGRLSVLIAAVFVFVLALVLLGYAISSFARTQMQAMQLTFFFFLPSLLLSGFMFPYRGMPGWAQALGEIFPLTHFIRAIRAVMLKGADLGDDRAGDGGARGVRAGLCARRAAALPADARLTGVSASRRRLTGGVAGGGEFPCGPTRVWRGWKAYGKWPESGHTN